MTREYLNAISEFERDPGLALNEIVNRHKSNVKWDSALKNNLKRKKKTTFKENFIQKTAYRPFIATNCYADYIFIQSKYQTDRIFSDASSENRVICVPGIGAKKQFSVFITNMVTDVNLNEAGTQCFPRYSYPKPLDGSDTTETFQGLDEVPERIDNITDTALRTFREHYSNNTITKDDIFDYIYGILHAPSYRKQFANDLSKMIPRIPFAPDFYAFAEVGAVLASLHLNCETCERYPDLKIEPLKPSLLWEEKPEHFVLGPRAMRFANKETRTTLIINEHVQLSGIPAEAHRYIVNGRTPLEWFIDRYKIKQDRESGILNDPNGWFEHPRDLITAIERIVYVSVESARIIEGLPSEIE